MNWILAHKFLCGLEKNLCFVCKPLVLRICIHKCYCRLAPYVKQNTKNVPKKIRPLVNKALISLF